MSLRDNRETLLLSDDYARIVPRLSPDGSKVSYSYAGWADPDRRADPRGTILESAIALLRTGSGGGDEQPLTSPPPKEEYAYDWSPDGQWLLGVSVRNTPGRTSICLFPVLAAPHAESGVRELVTDPDYRFWQPNFSPDGRWICLTAERIGGRGGSLVGVAPAAGGKWEPIIDDGYWADKPRWSPDGKMIFFISNQGTAFFDVWGVRFDSERGVAIGKPFQVTSLSNPGKMISRNVTHTEIALSETRLLLPLVERSGSIWMLTARPDEGAR
jgi:Tol biopolymer transport system component